MTQREKVTPLELFFDLVFVFALTQVTALMSQNASGQGILQGMAVLAALWWAWVAYAWLTNTVDPEEGVTRLVMFFAMAAMLVAALATPHAFGDDAELFVCAYFVVRATHIALYWIASREDPMLRGAVTRLASTLLPAAGIYVVAGFADGGLRTALWALALLVDYGGLMVRGVAGWRVHAGHFAERHALIIIIALGESIVAVGVGAEGVPITAGVVVATVLAIAVAAALWWAYFDVVAVVAERRLHAQEGDAQARMARDSYSYLHLPMIAGIVLFALGIKKTIGHLDEPLKTAPAAAMAGGVALYLVAHVAFRLRNVGSVNKQRVVAAALLAVLAAFGTDLDSGVLLGLVAAVLGGLIAYEAIHFAEARARVRHA